MRTGYALIAAGIVASFGGVAARTQAGPAVQPQAQSAQLAEGPGKDRVIAVCSGCHDVRIVIGQHHDAPGWRQIIDRMIDHGAIVSDPDGDVIEAYLAKAP